MEFAEWYVKMCNKMHESASAAALSIGCTEASGCYWANGDRVPRKTTLLKLEEHFGEKFNNENIPADFGEDDIELLDRINARPELKILMHNGAKATPEQIAQINALLESFIK